MKEIQGKIKFGVVELRNHSNMQNVFNVIGIELSSSIRLSKITEEQAAEFVDRFNECQFFDYLNNTHFNTAKESFISLLKANGVKTKEMADNLYDEIENLPDDLLLIKL